MKCTWTNTESAQTALQDVIQRLRPSSIWILCDRNTAKFCLPEISPAKENIGINLITLPIGEESKTLESCIKIWTAMSRKSADRNALLVCLGGGMICDLGAFAASVYKRGIPHILIPTSLLAMADACLGGKTGVDFLGSKNQLGTFREPVGILIYTGFLKTLNDTELLSGLAEICKHMLTGNAEAWNRLRKAEVHRQDWSALVQSSLEFKKAMVEADPFESGNRKILNAGHTIGHALESFFLESDNPQPHGYCVAAGLVTEGRIAVQLGFLAESELLQVEEFVYAEFGLLPLKKRDIARVLKFCRQDKKNKAGKIRAALYGPIGSCRIDVEITEVQIRSALEYYIGA